MEQEPMQTNQTPTTRRQFSKLLAAVAGAGAAAVPATALASNSVRASDTATDDDSELLKLEEEIFAAWRAAEDHDEAIALYDARLAEYERLLQEEKTQGRFISAKERWTLVNSAPEVERLTREVALSHEYRARMNGLIDQMLAIPAHTEAGRHAKVSVVLVCVLDWRDHDDLASRQTVIARQLFADLVGGEAGRNMREQFA
jgi:hypothetical protein